MTIGLSHQTQIYERFPLHLSNLNNATLRTCSKVVLQYVDTPPPASTLLLNSIFSNCPQFFLNLLTINASAAIFTSFSSFIHPFTLIGGKRKKQLGNYLPLFIKGYPLFADNSSTGKSRRDAKSLFI